MDELFRGRGRPAHFLPSSRGCPEIICPDLGELPHPKAGLSTRAADSL